LGSSFTFTLFSFLWNTRKNQKEKEKRDHSINLKSSSFPVALRELTRGDSMKIERLKEKKKRERFYK